MKIFHENGWQFQFDPGWRVLQFDRHRFYRYVSGYGIKGVDFLIWEKAYRLVQEEPTQVKLILFLALAENVSPKAEEIFFKTLKQQMELFLSPLGFPFFLAKHQRPFEGIQVIAKE